jgi:hypothetical protein
MRRLPDLGITSRVKSKLGAYFKHNRAAYVGLYQDRTEIEPYRTVGSRVTVNRAYANNLF